MPIDERQFYFIACIHNDCDAFVVGPMVSYEDAQKECNVSCQYAHRINRQGAIPPEDVEVLAPHPVADTALRIELRQWRKEHNARVYELRSQRKVHKSVHGMG